MKIPGLSFSWTNLVCLPCGRRTKVSRLKRDFAKAFMGLGRNLQDRNQHDEAITLMMFPVWTDVKFKRL